MFELHEGLWEKVDIDFVGLCHATTGEYLLVLVDKYSRFPTVEKIKSVPATKILGKFQKIFAEHNIPREVKSHTRGLKALTTDYEYM